MSSDLLLFHQGIGASWSGQQQLPHHLLSSIIIYYHLPSHPTPTHRCASTRTWPHIPVSFTSSVHTSQAAPSHHATRHRHQWLRLRAETSSRQAADGIRFNRQRRTYTANSPRSIACLDTIIDLVRPRGQTRVRRMPGSIPASPHTMRRQPLRSSATSTRNAATNPHALLQSYDSDINPSRPAKSSPLAGSTIAGLPLELLDRLKAFPLFQSAPESFLLSIGRSLRPSVFAPSQEIIRELSLIHI